MKNQVINEPITQVQKAMFNSVFSLIKDLSGESIRVGKDRVNNFEEYKATLSGKKRVINILCWEVTMVNFTFIKSNCPHVSMLLRDAQRTLNKINKAKS